MTNPPQDMQLNSIHSYTRSAALANRTVPDGRGEGDGYRFPVQACTLVPPGTHNTQKCGEPTLLQTKKNPTVCRALSIGFVELGTQVLFDATCAASMMVGSDFSDRQKLESGESWLGWASRRRDGSRLDY